MIKQIVFGNWKISSNANLGPLEVDPTENILIFDRHPNLLRLNGSGPKVYSLLGQIFAELV